MMNTGYKVVGRYVYPPIESVTTFETYEEARAELRRWKEDAKANKQEIQARVVKLKEAQP